MSLIPLWYLAFTLTPAGAQIKADVTPPVLDPAIVASGLYGNLQNQMETAVESAQLEIEDIANNTVYRPLLMSAFADSNALHPLAALYGETAMGAVTLSFGAWAGIASATLSKSEIETLIDELKPEDDAYLGAGLQGCTVNLSAPLRVKGLRFQLSGSLGYLDTRYEEYLFSSRMAQFSAAFAALPPRKLGRTAVWEGLQLRLGAQYVTNDITTEIVLDEPVSQSITYDPDGAGPQFGYTVTASVDPVLDVGVRSRATGMPVSVSTGFSLFGFLSLQAGAGAALNWGTTGISIEGEDDILVTGSIADLQEEPGHLTIYGTSEGAEPALLTWQLFGALRYRIGGMYLSVPLVWQQGTGVSSGVSLGVEL